MLMLNEQVSLRQMSLTSFPVKIKVYYQSLTAPYIKVALYSIFSANLYRRLYLFSTWEDKDF